MIDSHIRSDHEIFPNMKKVAKSVSSSSNYSSEQDSVSYNWEGSQCACNPVLVADDNEFNLFTFKQILKNNYNLESDGAFDGQDAVKKF